MDSCFRRNDKIPATATSTHPFYQRIHIPILGDVHYVLSMEDAGTVTQNGKQYRVLYWYQMDVETYQLDPKLSMRTEQNMGGWLIEQDPENPDRALSVSYFLSSYPIRDDTNAAQWFGLTVGADLTIKGVIKDSIEVMTDWAKQ